MKTPRLRRRKAGDIGALRRVMWGAILAAEQVALDPDAETAEKLRAANAIATLAGAYARGHEQAELLPRLEALEARIAEGKRP
jgi:hypothetical protein